MGPWSRRVQVEPMSLAGYQQKDATIAGNGLIHQDKVSVHIFHLDAEKFVSGAQVKIILYATS